MKRILKNINGEATVDTIYNGKRYVIGPKKTLTLDHDGNDEQAADYLLQTYGFLKEITPKANFDNPDQKISKDEVSKAEPNKSYARNYRHTT